MKKLIALLAVCLITSATMAADSTNPPVFQIRLILDSPSADSEPMAIPYKQRAAETVNVQKTVLLDQTSLKSAKVHADPFGHPQIGIVFNDEGRKRFAEVSRQNIGKRLAIVIAGQIQCAPVVNSEISGGKAEISGSFSKEEAADLAKKLNAAIVKTYK